MGTTGRPAALESELIGYRTYGGFFLDVQAREADGDDKADEMEIRHYRDGYLRYAWFGENYDHGGPQIFALKDWNYAGRVISTVSFAAMSSSI